MAVYKFPALEMQVPATSSLGLLDQANPVQNTWYTVLSITGRSGLLLFGGAGIATTNETLEYEVTIDGHLYATLGFAATAGTTAEAYCRAHALSQVLEINLDTTSKTFSRLDLPFKNSVLVRLRKTTAAGAGDLRGIAAYWLWEG